MLKYAVAFQPGLFLTHNLPLLQKLCPGPCQRWYGPPLGLWLMRGSAAIMETSSVLRWVRSYRLFLEEKQTLDFTQQWLKKNWLTRLGSTKDAEVSVCDPYGWCHFLGTPWVQQNRGSRPSALTTDHLYRVHVRPLSPRGGAGAHSSLWARAGSHPGQTEYRQTRNQTSNSVILFHRCLFSLRSLFRHSAS